MGYPWLALNLFEACNIRFWNAGCGLWQGGTAREVSLAALTKDVCDLWCGMLLLNAGTWWWFHKSYGCKQLPAQAGVVSKVCLGIGMAVVLEFDAPLHKMAWIPC